MEDSVIARIIKGSGAVNFGEHWYSREIPPMNDEIVDEVRRLREAYAAKFDYDIRRMVEDLRRRERESGREYLCLPPKEPLGPVLVVRGDL